MRVVSSFAAAATTTTMMCPSSLEVLLYRMLAAEETACNINV
jgi:hypothetical protein